MYNLFIRFLHFTWNQWLISSLNTGGKKKNKKTIFHFFRVKEEDQFFLVIFWSISQTYKTTTLNFEHAHERKLLSFMWKQFLFLLYARGYLVIRYEEYFNPRLQIREMRFTEEGETLNAQWKYLFMNTCKCFFRFHRPSNMIA